jgi:hypothetical protein
MQKAPGASLRGLFSTDERRNYMVFGAAVVAAGFAAAGFVVFFAAVFLAAVFLVAVFLAVVFFAVAFLAGAAVLAAGAVVEGLVVVLVLCACAVTNGTVDAPTNASRANAEINAFILGLLSVFLGCGQEGVAAPVPVEPSTDAKRADTNMFRRIGDKFRASNSHNPVAPF